VVLRKRSGSREAYKISAERLSVPSAPGPPVAHVRRIIVNRKVRGTVAEHKDALSTSLEVRYPEAGEGVAPVTEIKIYWKLIPL
jgi:hypothetical protein